MEKPNGFDKPDKLTDEYFIYIKSQEWQNKRTERLKIDGFKCGKCGTTKNLEVHHLNYSRFGNENVYTDLITLCRDCHDEIEREKTGENERRREEAQKYSELLRRRKEEQSRKATLQEKADIIIRDFVANCDDNSLDYADLGCYNLCDYKVIVPLATEYLLKRGFTQIDDIWIPAGKIQEYFAKKRFKVIKELRTLGWEDYAIKRKYKFSNKQLSKSDEELNLFIRKNITF